MAKDNTPKPPAAPRKATTFDVAKIDERQALHAARIAIGDADYEATLHVNSDTGEFVSLTLEGDKKYALKGSEHEVVYDAPCNVFTFHGDFGGVETRINAQTGELVSLASVG